MKPIHEITLFESAKEVADINAFVQTGNWIEACIPLGGMLVNEKLLIHKTTSDKLIARTTNIGNFCSSNGSIPVFLKLDHDQTIIVSRLERLQINDDEIHLGDFRLLKHGWRDRSEERVQPKNPIYFTFFAGSQEIRANLHDVSLKGLCLIANISLVEIPQEIKDSYLTLPLNIHPFIEAYSIRGIIKNCRSLTDSLTRIGLEIFLDRNGFKNLSNYIQTRKREIMEEVFSNFKALLNYRHVPDLQF